MVYCLQSHPSTCLVPMHPIISPLPAVMLTSRSWFQTSPHYWLPPYLKTHTAMAICCGKYCRGLMSFCLCCLYSSPYLSFVDFQCFGISLPFYLPSFISAHISDSKSSKLALVNSLFCSLLPRKILTSTTTAYLSWYNDLIQLDLSGSSASSIPRSI